MGFELPKVAIGAIDSAVDSLFARAKARFLGPNWGGKKIIVGWKLEDSLPGLFGASSAEEHAAPNLKTLDRLLHIADGYIESQRASTKSKLVQSIGAFLQNASQKGVVTDWETVLEGMLSGIWGQTSSNLARIVDTEGTTARNMGGLDGIVEVNERFGIDDPVVYFVVVKDSLLCSECKRLHLLEDGVTPRVWLLSEVGHEYHHRGDPNPKIGGLHPNCFVDTVRLFTDSGIYTIGELYKAQNAVNVVVDARIKCRKEPANQYGVETPGKNFIDRRAPGSVILPATPVYYTGERECVRVVLDSGHSLDVSIDHDFWVDDDNAGKKIPASELKIGDKVPILSGVGGFGSDHFPEHAELMGNLLGDGGLGNVTASWDFFGNDIEYGRRLKKMAAGIVEGKFHGRLESELTVSLADGKYNVEHAEFNSPVFRKIFVREFGLSKKPRRVPERLWRSDEDTVRSFLRGLYAADGHSERAGTVVLGQNDFEFLKEIQLLLANLGFCSRIFVHDEACDKVITYADGRKFNTHRKKCWRLMIGGINQVNRFNSEIGWGVPEKQKRAEAYFAQRGLDMGKKLGHWRTAHIASITPIGVQKTYCLTEPKTNTVTANGIVVGNCRCSLVSLLKDYGFDKKGAVTYISSGHDELAKQRNT